MTRLSMIALLLAVSCKNGDGDEPAGELSGCDPTDPSVCALPFPSSYFQVADDAMPSGVRNAFRLGT